MNSNYMAYKLAALIDPPQLVSLFTDADYPDDFTSGVIQRVGNSHFLTCDVAPWGDTDGYRVRRIGDVQELICGDDYEVRLDLLMEIKGSKLKPLDLSPYGPECGVLLSTLQYCRDQGEIVTVIIDRDGFSGFVKECNDLYVKMDIFNIFGKIEGEEKFNLREIDVLQVATAEEITYRILHDANVSAMHK